MPRLSSLLVAAVSMLALTGGSSRSYGAAAPSGACGLITRQEAATALGTAVPAGAEKIMDVSFQGGAPIKMQSCLYGSGVVVAAPTCSTAETGAPTPTSAGVRSAARATAPCRPNANSAVYPIMATR